MALDKAAAVAMSQVEQLVECTNYEMVFCNVCISTTPLFKGVPQMHLPIALSACFSALLMGQSGSRPTNPTVPLAPIHVSKERSDVPVRLIYRAFFNHVLVMEKEANKIDANGERGVDVRNYYKDQIGLTYGEAVILLQVSHNLEEFMAKEDEKANAFIKSTRNAHATDQKPTPGLIEARRQESHRLAAEREKAIDTQIELLRSRLFEPGFKKVDDFVRTVFASNVTITTIQAPAEMGGGQ